MKTTEYQVIQNKLHSVEIKLRVVFDAHLDVTQRDHAVNLGHVAKLELVLVEVVHDTHCCHQEVTAALIISGEHGVHRHVIKRFAHIFRLAELVPYFHGVVEVGVGGIELLADYAVITKTVVNISHISEVILLGKNLKALSVEMIDGGIIAEAGRENDILFVSSEFDGFIAQQIRKMHTLLVVVVRLAEFRVVIVIASVVAEAEKIDISQMIVILVFLRGFQEIGFRFEFNAPQIYISPTAEFDHAFEQLCLEHEIFVAGFRGKFGAILRIFLSQSILT